MTRNTFEAVAKAVNKQLRKNRHSPAARIKVIEAAGNFAALAAADNPRFCVHKFVNACTAGVTKAE